MHTPFINVVGDLATITVGSSALHPMTPSSDPDQVHWISHIFVRDQHGRTFFTKMLAPNEGSYADVTFGIPAGVTRMTAYAFCNKHGLYVGPSTSYDGVGRVARDVCSVDKASISEANGLATE